MRPLNTELINKIHEELYNLKGDVWLNELARRLGTYEALLSYYLKKYFANEIMMVKLEKNNSKKPSLILIKRK